MLKHATISRTNRAQQTLQLQRQWEQQQQQLQSLSAPRATSPQQNDGTLDLSVSSFNCDNSPSPQLPISASCSPIPSTASTFALRGLQSATNSSISLSPQTICYQTQSTNGNLTRNKQQQQCSSDSMIKVFAQSLSQEVEYITLHVNTQTKSNQIVKSLLRKFRLKHRDPNLFYLTLERWIRKDGLKFKSVMLLGDEACPLQLQQCCSNPPHNDIKFTLQMRAGALVKIHCSDVVPDARYKCLSLSTHTTVEETIELMLHCLNLAGAPSSTNTSKLSEDNLNHHHHDHPRLSGSPSSTGSSTSSSNSSSSGIESDPNPNHHHHQDHRLTNTATNRLDSGSRASSVTSISSTSNMSNISTSFTDQYCMVIECKGTNFKRCLDSDEYLVDVYQSLLSEAKGQQLEQEHQVAGLSSPKSVANGNSSLEPIKADQWFSIRLKRRDDFNQTPAIKFTNPRQNVPLPPIPMSLTQQFNNVHDMQRIVSTTQIEVNSRRSSSSLAASSSGLMCVADDRATAQTPTERPPTANSNTAPIPGGELRHQMPQFILLPPVRPRRRNLSNASSTFGRPLNIHNDNRRRYDPAQLAEDLNRLDVKEPSFGS